MLDKALVGGIAFVGGIDNLKFHMLDPRIIDGIIGGQDAGVLLAEVIASHTGIEKLYLWNTDLIGKDNVEQWGKSLLKNKKLTYLGLDGVTDEIREQLRDATKDRSLKID
eukprot:CAMPEP_0198249616 /NCGR_PEP_ID=MMETSP1447-20131203/1091_1 /TAXON_ID=420782 /ORGANISM="Chaetoceros dichaeta, Strain CCMP1751" /LENGTH=109 /DNA_ID=CAMNT_0043934295 /DNA_START=1 /DNA_END=327 /DNA_ORIENTATION=-